MTSYRTFRLNKLVRDKIIDLTLEYGGKVRARKLSGKELNQALIQKLIEEAHELARAEISVGELADLQEIIDQLSKNLGISKTELEDTRARKLKKAGGFNNGDFIDTLSAPADNEWADYYGSDPRRFPETASTAADVNKLLEFTEFTHRIREVKRAIILDDESHENDMEHSYQMALVAWFIIENDRLALDTNKAVGMAMVHDIVEAYNGDISAFADPEKVKAHKAAEKESAKRLKKDWPTFTSLHALIEEYEERESPEAKFVYALDKLVPTFNNYLYGGKAWRAQDLSLADITRFKTGKIDIDETVGEYWQQMKEILEENQEMFARKS